MRGRADDAAARGAGRRRLPRRAGRRRARRAHPAPGRLAAPRSRRRPSRSLRATFAVLLAGLTLGGVAVAAIGPVSHDDAGRRDRSRGPARPRSVPRPVRRPRRSVAPVSRCPPRQRLRDAVRRGPGHGGPLPCVRRGRGARATPGGARPGSGLSRRRAARSRVDGVLAESWPSAPRRRTREAESADAEDAASPGSRVGGRRRRARRHRSRRSQGRAVGASGRDRRGGRGRKATVGAPGLRWGGRAARGRPSPAPVVAADGNGRGRHPPQERPRPSRGTGRAATRTLYSAAPAFSVTPRRSRGSCMLYGHGRGAVSGRNVPFAPGRGAETGPATTAAPRPQPSIEEPRRREPGPRERRRLRRRGGAGVLGDDAELTAAVLAAQDGDETAFRTVYRAVHPRLLGYVRTLVGEPDAEDVTSEAWLQIARDLDRFSGDADRFRGWAARIARNRALDHIRMRGRRPAIGGDETELTGQAAESDTAGEAIEALATGRALSLIAQLPQDQAEAVVLRVVVGLDAKTRRRDPRQAPRRRTDGRAPGSEAARRTARRRSGIRRRARRRSPTKRIPHTCGDVRRCDSDVDMPSTRSVQVCFAVTLADVTARVRGSRCGGRASSTPADSGSCRAVPPAASGRGARPCGRRRGACRGSRRRVLASRPTTTRRTTASAWSCGSRAMSERVLPVASASIASPAVSDSAAWPVSSVSSPPIAGGGRASVCGPARGCGRSGRPSRGSGPRRR